MLILYSSNLLQSQIFFLPFKAYGKRMMKICDFANIEYDYNISPEYLPVPLDVVEKFLSNKEKQYK